MQMEALLAESYATVKQMLARNRQALDRCAPPVAGAACSTLCLRRLPQHSARADRPCSSVLSAPCRVLHARFQLPSSCCPAEQPRGWAALRDGRSRACASRSNDCPCHPPPHPPCSLMAALLEKNTLTGEDVRALVEQHAAAEDLQRRDAERAAFL